MVYRFFLISIFICFLCNPLIFSFSDQEILCSGEFPVELTSYSFSYLYCNAEGEIIRKETMFKKTHQFSRIQHYEKGRLVRVETSDIDRLKRAETRYEYLGHGRFYKISLSMKPETYLQIFKKHLYQAVEGSDKIILLQTWFYELNNEKNRFECYQIDHFHPQIAGRVIMREVLIPQGGESGRVLLYYPNSTQRLNTNKVSGFDFYNPQGDKAGRYHLSDPIESLDQIIDNQDLTAEEKSRRKNILHTYRPPVGVVDTGFDLSHPRLTYKLYKNPFEIKDGRDNDNNTLVDDLWGWYWARDISTGDIRDRLVLESRDIPFSHGTHVSDIALNDIEAYSLLGYGGDITQVVFLRLIQKEFLRHSVRFANLSFGFGDENNPQLNDINSLPAIRALIKETPNTLHFVAAGNAPIDVDVKFDYPASLDYKNMIVVAALETDQLDLKEMPNYKMAPFSSFGKINVDILAPGEMVLAAEAGGSVIRISGTSMAAPFTLNVVLKMSLINPKLSILELKEILLKTAYIPNIEKPFPVSSGGIIYPERAYSATQQTIDQSISVRDAIFQSRQAENLQLPGELTSEEYLQQLEQLWLERKLSELPNDAKSSLDN